MTDYTDNDTASSSVILTGAVGDYGTAKRDDKLGRLSMTLSHGTFSLDFTGLVQELQTAVGTLQINQASCSAEASVSGQAAVVPGTGTGSYANDSGSFDLTITLDEVYHAGACNETAPYEAQMVFTTGWGHISHT